MVDNHTKKSHFTTLLAFEFSRQKSTIKSTNTISTNFSAKIQIFEFKENESSNETFLVIFKHCVRSTFLKMQLGMQHFGHKRQGIS